MSIAHPPVRTRVPLARWPVSRSQHLMRSVFPDHDFVLCRSGTDALALALSLAAARHETRLGAPPEVIVPAYGCPDLVTACVAAKVRARIVDIMPDTWGYDEAALRASVGRNTLGVVAVNLLGLGDGAERIAAIIGGGAGSPTELKIGIVRDSAQHLPGAAQVAPGDAVVLSFGRGKPVNALGSGLLLLPRGSGTGADILRTSTRSERVRDGIMGSRVASAAFNFLTHGRTYGIASRLPGLKLGATRYRPADGIAMAPVDAWRRIGPALEQFLAASDATGHWRRVLPELALLGIRPPLSADVRDRTLQSERMLRLPLLARGKAHRDRLVVALNQRGLGASRMYEVPLNRIPGLPVDIASQGPFPNADRFADLLFTVPTHASVTERVVSEAVRCMQASKSV